MRAGLALSASGHLVHNLAEFGPGWALVVNSLLPLAVTALLFRGAKGASGRYILLVRAWVLLVVVGGAASVLPLPLLPFTPAQTVRHYVAHGAYVLLQLPLLLVVWSGALSRFREGVPLSVRGPMQPQDADRRRRQ